MKRGTGFSLRDASERAAHDGARSKAYMYHASIVAARELGIYERGRGYSEKEVQAICLVITRLFPPRGTD